MRFDRLQRPAHLPLKARVILDQKDADVFGLGCSAGHLKTDLALDLEITTNAVHNLACLIGANSQSAVLRRPQGPKELRIDEFLRHARAVIDDVDAGTLPPP